jgi:hypothetical protein
LRTISRVSVASLRECSGAFLRYSTVITMFLPPH